MPNRPSAAVVLLAAAAATAHADIVDMYFSGPGRGMQVQIEVDDRTISTFAGQLIHEVTAADEALESFVGAQPFFCTDVFQPTSRHTLPFTLTNLTGVPDSQPMSSTTANAVRSLFASAGQAQFASDAPDDLAAAFQLALWEVVTDYDALVGRDSLSLDSGRFSASGPSSQPLTPSVLARLDTLFSAVGAGEQFLGEVTAFRSPVAQDQLTAVAGVPATIPTSGSLASFSMGLALAFGRRRR